MKNLITRAITGIAFVAIMIVGICYRGDVMVGLFAFITGMTIWEFSGLVNATEDVDINRFITTAAGVYFFLAMAGFCSGLTPSAVFIPYLVTIVYLFISELYLKKKNPLHNWAYTMFSQMYIALPLAMINLLGFHGDGTMTPAYDRLLPMSIFAFLWINDTGAYCSGSLLGRHKLFPRVSPGKSWEGSIGGGLLVLAAAAAVGYFNLHSSMEHAALLTIPQWMGLGLVVVVFGTWGDLVESLFKRALGVKDSGNILPGHGGMLDRFDSSLMAMPAAVIYLYTISLV